MRVVELIDRKRRGESHSAAEIEFLVGAFTRGDIPDYQMAAWLMAVCWRGMSDVELLALTQAMAASGEQLDLSDIAPLVADKHSTGGVGDKTTLVVLPLVAAAGLPVAKMSGRGLGFTGGTLDKLESIPGFCVDLSIAEFRRILGSTGLVLAGQSDRLAPADGKLYALRDATATVASLPLIASSIMSKKLAAGANVIVLDVKVGNGAFMSTRAEAEALAAAMVALGRQAGRRVSAVIGEMDQPLGQAVGNALEVVEAVETLRGGGPADLREHSLALAGEMLVLVGLSPDAPAAHRRLADLLASGAALDKCRAWVAAQGGDARIVDDPGLLPRAPVMLDVPSPCAGVVTRLDAAAVGWAALDLGAGRGVKGAPVDHAVGFLFRAKAGARVEAGETLFTVHARTAERAEVAARRVLAAYGWAAE